MDGTFRISMQQELISIIVPIYDGAKYLPLCLRSIENQTYTNLEIILVDDGSTDGSGKMCDEFAARDSRVKVIHQFNMGLWSARNAGQAASTGDYLMFPDADDYFHNDTIRLLYEAINQGCEYDLAIVREKRTWRANEDVSSIVIPRFVEQSQEDLIAGLLSSKDDRFYVYMWNKLYRRELIKDIYSRNYARSQDYDVNFRIFLQVEKAILIDNDLYYWFQHCGSLTTACHASVTMNACRTRILFSNYMDLPSNKAQYDHFLLSRLFKMMAFWKARSLKERDSKDVFRECREYERLTKKAYLLDKRIGFPEKMVCLFLLHSPRCMRLLMRISKNL